MLITESSRFPKLYDSPVIMVSLSPVIDDLEKLGRNGKVNVVRRVLDAGQRLGLGLKVDLKPVKEAPSNVYRLRIGGYRLRVLKIEPRVYCFDGIARKQDADRGFYCS